MPKYDEQGTAELCIQDALNLLENGVDGNLNFGINFHPHTYGAWKAIMKEAEKEPETFIIQRRHITGNLFCTQIAHKSQAGNPIHDQNEVTVFDPHFNSSDNRL